MPADGDEPQVRFVEATVGPPASELIDTGPPPRHIDRRWIAAAALAATLVIGIAIGFASGRHSTNGAPATTVTRPAPASLAPSLASIEYPTVGARCSAQSGKQLQLGIEIVNPSDLPLTIDRVQPLLPLGGLRTKSITRGGCGQLSPTRSDDAVAGYEVAARASVWITIEVDVLTPCPAPYPVQVRLQFTELRRQFSTELPAFVDLGEVPYTGCPTS
jgi:hypothetical protein